MNAVMVAAHAAGNVLIYLFSSHAAITPLAVLGAYNLLVLTIGIAFQRGYLIAAAAFALAISGAVLR